VVLVRVSRRRIEEKRFSLLVLRPKLPVVEPVMDDADPLGLDAEALDENLAGVLARDEEEAARAGKAAVNEAAVDPLATGERLWADEVKDVVDRRNRSGSTTVGTITASAKWIASKRSRSSCRRTLVENRLARLIALRRPDMERLARYAVTVVVGRPLPASGAIVGPKTR
jgi:hypothetical protein